MIQRYTLPEMGRLWSDQTKFATWLEVEIEAAHAMAAYRIIPRAAAEQIKKKGRFNVDRINELEKELNHDVIAFLTNVSEHIGEPAKYLHYGMTSSDVVDTALSLQLKRAGEVLDKKLAALLTKCERLAKKYKKTPCIGRTHGVIAEPMSAGLKFAAWYCQLKRRRQDLESARKSIEVGCLSGPVGSFAELDPRVEARVCKQLGLRPARVSTQVIQRDHHAQFVCSLAQLGAVLERIAVEIRSLQRTEIGEMAEGFTKTQKGSSAMPHKRNPITAERITGIARLLRGYASAALENVALWHERDISHSSVERVILPDATIVLDYALHKMNELLENLTVNEARMLQNINYAGGIVFSQRVLLVLAERMGDRDKAYRIVQRLAFQAVDGKGAFHSLVSADSEVKKYMSVSEVKDCFRLEHYLAHVPTIMGQVFR